MPDVTQTAANVKPGTGAQYLPGGQPGLAGEVLTAGNLVYRKAADSKFYKGDASVALVAPATYPPETAITGIVVNSAAVDQASIIQTGGVVNIGGTTVKGMYYVLSPTNPGGIAPITDLASAQTPPHWPVIFGQAIDTLGNVQIGVIQNNISM